MTNSTDIFINIRDFNDPTQIHLSNGSNLPIFKVGDITGTIKNVFVSLKLSISLISVGQLVDNNSNVNFSHNSCLVQDQVWGTIIAKVPKVERLFPLHFSIPRVQAFASTTAKN